MWGGGVVIELNRRYNARAAFSGEVFHAIPVRRSLLFWYLCKTKVRDVGVNRTYYAYERIPAWRLMEKD